MRIRDGDGPALQPNHATDILIVISADTPSRITV
jgi:hypothetical protein